MKRTAHVAFAPHGKDNVNRLRVPELGIAKLVVKTAHQASKSYQSAGAKHLPSSNDGTDTFNFAPGLEPAQIVYEIFDPFAAVRGAKLELFGRYQPDPLWTLDFATFGATWWGHGTHTIKWDGRIVRADHLRDCSPGDQGYQHDLTAIAPERSQAGFPDGYVNLEHTIYKLKLTIAADGLAGEPSVAWTYFLVLAEKLKLEFGPAKVLPAPVAGKGDHRAVLADLVGREPTPPKPADGKTVKVFLDSDIYKHSLADPNDDEMFHNALFDAYRARWGAGPLIPLFVKVTILDSQGHGVDAPKAIGNVKFLWEWESKSARAATGRHGDAFINNAQTYDVDVSKPKGRNCHVDRGGKRSNPSAAIFPAQKGREPQDTLDDGVFPFKVESVPNQRTWAAYSYAWRDHLLAGKTGVLFRPSRMAGDSYTVSVYLAWDVDRDGNNLLDTETEPLVVPAPEKVSASTGIFQIWRRTHLRKHLAKTVGAPALDLDAIAACYTDSFMEIADAAGAMQTVPEQDWNDAVATAITGWSDVDRLLLDPAAQHSGGAAGVIFHRRDDFMRRWRRLSIETALTTLGVAPGNAGTIAAAASAAATAANAFAVARTQAGNVGYSPPDRTTIATAARGEWETVRTWMSDPGNGWNTAMDYANDMEDRASQILKQIFDGRFDADPGITIFQVESPHNLIGDQAGYTDGEAHDFDAVQTEARPTRCGFLLMRDTAAGIDKISAHEIGHHFFLPHPTDTAECADYKAHDQVVPSLCLMSYNDDLDLHLCGFCQLRLRGWDKDALKPDGSKNQKPP